jgi:hypothetical protein
MLDFTLKIYQSLLNSLLEKGFSFQTFGEYLCNPANKVIILRHDVDLNPLNSLIMAKTESDLGIRGSYYFRIVPGSNHPGIIREIAALEHEIGYHYEDLSLVWKKRGDNGEKFRLSEKGIMELYKTGIKSFVKHLEYFRQFHPVNTICMHGSPLSRWDSRLLWKYYDYKDFGIIGEPYFDIDFDEFLYLTDTARRWDGEAYSVRDKELVEKLQGAGSVKERSGGDYSDWKVQPFKYRQSHNPISPSHPIRLKPPHLYHSTYDIINAANEGRLTGKIMITLHPQRWTDKLCPWVKELVWQNVKNQVKLLMVLKYRRSMSSNFHLEHSS